VRMIVVGDVEAMLWFGPGSERSRAMNVIADCDA